MTSHLPKIKKICLKRECPQLPDNGPALYSSKLLQYLWFTGLVDIMIFMATNAPALFVSPAMNMITSSPCTTVPGQVGGI